MQGSKYVPAAAISQRTRHVLSKMAVFQSIFSCLFATPRPGATWEPKVATSVLKIFRDEDLDHLDTFASRTSISCVLNGTFTVG